MEEIKADTPVLDTLEEVKPEPTLQEYKKAMRLFFTVRNPVVEQCGHQFHRERQPNNNCEYCWFAFFNEYGEMTSEVDKFFRKYGRNALIKVRGEKFTKMFTRFMATVAKFMEEQQQNITKPCPIEGHTGFVGKCNECVKGIDGKTEGSEVGSGTDAIREAS